MGGDRLTKHPIYLVFLLRIVVSRLNVCDLKRMGIASMHEWKVPLTYWCVHLTLSGPLGYCRAVERGRHHDLWGRYLTKGGDK